MAKTAAEKKLDTFLSTASKHRVEDILESSEKVFGVPLATFALPEVFSTGNIIIDAAIGVGGIPRGRVTELYGPPSSGKTTTALQAAAEAQAQGEMVAYFDFENDLDEDYCASLGLDTSREAGFLHIQPPSLERGMNLMRALLKAEDPPGIFVVDSVAMMTTDSEAEMATGDRAGPMEKARLLAQVMRQARNDIKNANAAVVFINHLQEKVDMSPIGQRLARQGIKQKTTPGGNAIKFAASLRIEYKQVGNRTAKEVSEITNEAATTVVATRVKVTVTKNKLAPPFKSAEVTVRYGRGFSAAQAAFDVLVAHNAVKKNGAWFTFPEALSPTVDADGHYLVTGITPIETGGVKVHGEDSAVEALDADEEWLSRCRTAAIDLVHEHVAAKEADKPQPIRALVDPELEALLGEESA